MTVIEQATAAPGELRVTNVCKKCGAPIPRTGKRGRPRTICEACRRG